MRPSNRRALILPRSCCVLALLASLLVGGLVAGSTSAQSLPPVPAPRLDAPDALEGHLTFRATGLDPMAPRDLVLWVWEGRSDRKIATTRSTPGGRFDFGQQPIPAGASVFHVSLAGHTPDRSRGIEIVRRTPGPVLVTSDAEPDVVHVLPARSTGSLRVRDARSGRLLLLRPIDSFAPHGHRLDLAREGILEQSGWLAFDQLFTDGPPSRASYWERDAR